MFYVVTVSLLVALLVWWMRRSPVSNDTLDRAEQALAEGDLRNAGRIANQILAHDVRNPRARLVAAKCRAAQGLPEDALEILTGHPFTQTSHHVEAACLAGDISFMQLYRPSAAETLYRKALQKDPTSVQANDRLAVLLTITGQWWDQIPVRLTSVRNHRFSPLDLHFMALGHNALANPEFAEQMSNVSPDDPLVLLATARLAAERGRHDDAVRLLTRASEEEADLVQAQVLLGTEFFHLRDETRFTNWLRQLPPTADNHPAIWVLRGKWAAERGHRAAALRCFCEAIQRDPNYSDALYQCGTILESMGRTNEAKPFLVRAKQLQNFINETKAVDSNDLNHRTRRAAEQAESLGNYWEAWGWASIAAARRDPPDWSRKMVTRLHKMLPSLPLQRTHPRSNPVASFDFRVLPEFKTLELMHKSAAASADGPVALFSFRDQTKSAGLDFQYFNGSTDVSHGLKNMYEVMGGGVAVLDFNGDDLPDLYFTQGSSWPALESNDEFIDGLYLNTGSGMFVDIAHKAGIIEGQFGQGVAVGDVNSDGFPDILVANIGRNRLFRNNGDGTYQDMSHEAGFERSDWTTSCAIADLTGDGDPELYVVNYLQGDDLFTRMCGPQQDRVCLPQNFSAAPDQMFRNLGNDQFQDATESFGLDVEDGKGLGIVVGAFGDSPELDVFVANDTVSNFFFEQGSSARIADTDQPAGRKFRENALVAGLALNGEGTSQACMGVAAGDADGDGAIDLFITNFHGEPNTLYRQLSGGFFEDVSVRQGLRQPSLSNLGFGTQFLDADLDGRLDLVVSNGHIDNYSQDGSTEYRMQPQFFANRNPAGFIEADSQSLGPYFSGRFLGRALARLDWNSDGREDFVVTHLDAPAALLENTTQPHGNWVTFKLCGVESSRDAVGTVVEARTANHRLTRQLTAGDGFQACNQRVLTFGLGPDKLIEQLTVRWPSGKTDEFSNIPASTRGIIIEGRKTLFRLPD